jgi:hypothetical protein
MLNCGCRILVNITGLQEFTAAAEEASPHFSERVIRRLVKRLHDPSSDVREYRSIQSILSTLYRLFPRKRANLRKSLGAGLHDCSLYSGQSLAALLSVIAPIVRGFSEPLNDAHLSLLTLLLPLHEPNSMENENTPTLGLYHKQLVYCILQLVERRPDWTTQALHGVLSHWPSSRMCNTAKAREL